jgi:hypothetical protein
MAVHQSTRGSWSNRSNHTVLEPNNPRFALPEGIASLGDTTNPKACGVRR